MLIWHILYILEWQFSTCPCCIRCSSMDRCISYTVLISVILVATTVPNNHPVRQSKWIFFCKLLTKSDDHLESGALASHNRAVVVLSRHLTPKIMSPSWEWFLFIYSYLYPIQRCYSSVVILRIPVWKWYTKTSWQCSVTEALQQQVIWFTENYSTMWYFNWWQVMEDVLDF